MHKNSQELDSLALYSSFEESSEFANESTKLSLTLTLQLRKHCANELLEGSVSGIDHSHCFIFANFTCSLSGVLQVPLPSMPRGDDVTPGAPN